jgi:signal peptidase I
MMVVVSVVGNSMRPTLCHGERVLAYSRSAKHPLTRNCVVTLFHFETQISCEPQPYSTKVTTIVGQRELFVKRIVGLPNDTVRIPVGQLSKQVLPMINPHRVCHDEYCWHVAEDHVFVRGDAAFSIDSVVWGPIPLTQIQHIIWCRFPSFQRVR